MSINPEIAGRIRGGRFVPGVSGNPAGKPPGAPVRATRLAEKLMARDAEAVIRAVIKAAKGGDMTAAKIILDRIAPLCRGRRVRLNLPPICCGRWPPWSMPCPEGSSRARKRSAAVVLEHHRKAVETFGLERRLAALERKNANSNER